MNSCEGSDRRTSTTASPTSCFNSRSREGSDLYSRVVISLSEVSIHAPARGATQRVSGAFGKFGVSIHAPARGATKAVFQWARGHAFQFTLPRGERRLLSNHTTKIIRFNSRSREGSDVAIARLEWRDDSFNSRSREGSDVEVLAKLHSQDSFNSRSREGSDVVSKFRRVNTRVSIHAPARGATSHLLLGAVLDEVSIHAPARGATIPIS